MASGSCRRLVLCIVAPAAFIVAAAPSRAADRAADPAARAASEAAALRRAERADYQLLTIYPDLATYSRLKAAEIDVVKGHLHQAGLRLSEFLAKRKLLNEKAEFYRGKPLPPGLLADMDASDASFTASMYVFRGLEQDVARIVDKYERPRERLEKLWAGASIGSLGLYDPGAAAPPEK